jgi:hypothetical protein
MAFALALTAAAGCSPVETERLKATSYASTGKVVYVGTFYDQRPPITAGPDGDVASPDLREIRIPAEEVRSVLADALERSKLFPAVLNPPAAFAGESPDKMIHNAQQSSDYLLVGEVNQFHIKSKGYNSLAAISVPMDALMFVSALITYTASAGHSFLFSGTVIGCWSAEAVLTMSVSLIDTETGKAVHTVRLEERVESPYDATDAYGAFWDGDDDWIDLGRRLGETALHNAGVHLAKALDRARDRLAPPPKGRAVTGGARR